MTIFRSVIVVRAGLSKSKWFNELRDSYVQHQRHNRLGPPSHDKGFWLSQVPTDLSVTVESVILFLQKFIEASADA